MSGVVCAGSIVVDVGKIIEAYPPLDHITTIEDVSLSTGGPGLNMAVDLRALGATFPLVMLGAVGDDQHGAFVLDECARLGIDAAGVERLPGVATSFTDARSSTTSGPTAVSTAPWPRCPMPASCTSERPGCTRSWTRPPRTATAGRRCSAGRAPRGCTRTWSW
jgi:hypothetical protein